MNTNKDIKKLWETELNILTEFEKICLNNNIKWFAIAGTLLGAIRHNGFIPWDDDLDVAMFADDYYKFCEKAESELNDPFEMQYYKTGNKLTPWHLKIRNKKTTGFTEWERKRMPNAYNKGIFIDVFPLYNIPDEKKEEEKLVNKIKKMKTKIEMCQESFFYKEKGNPGLFQYSFAKYSSFYINLFGGYDKYCKKYLDLCNSIKNTSKRVGMISFLPGNGRFVFDRSFFDELIEWKFENTKIPIPKNFDECLKISYGDYMTPVKNTQVHSGLTYDVNTPYSIYNDLD